MPRAQAMFGLAGLVLAIFMVLSAKSEPQQQASISCKEVVTDMVNCADFLKLGSFETKPLPACCDGIKQLGGVVKDKQDLVDICNCVKKDLAGFGNFGYNFGRVTELPNACGLSETFPPLTRILIALSHPILDITKKEILELAKPMPVTLYDSKCLGFSLCVAADGIATDDTIMSLS